VEQRLPDRSTTSREPPPKHCARITFDRRQTSYGGREADVWRHATAGINPTVARQVRLGEFGGLDFGLNAKKP
jgi:hypothetical protein